MQSTSWILKAMLYTLRKNNNAVFIYLFLTSTGWEEKLTIGN